MILTTQSLFFVFCRLTLATRQSGTPSRRVSKRRPYVSAPDRRYSYSHSSDCYSHYDTANLNSCLRSNCHLQAEWKFDIPLTKAHKKALIKHYNFIRAFLSIGQLRLISSAEPTVHGLFPLALQYQPNFDTLCRCLSRSFWRNRG